MSPVQAGETCVSPAFPEFGKVDIPKQVYLTKITCDGPDRKPVTPSFAYRGTMQPFASEADSHMVARLLAGSFGVDVHGGFLLPDERAQKLPSVPVSSSSCGLTSQFDVLILGFDHTPDLWAFSLDPPISAAINKGHPHLRGDREVVWDGRTLNAFCVYSAAEFSIKGFPCRLTEFLRQVSIYLGKHVLWLASEPRRWLGNVAASGTGHLALDPLGQCWCGDGKIYKHCCLPGEVLRFLRTVRGISVPPGVQITVR